MSNAKNFTLSGLSGGKLNWLDPGGAQLTNFADGKGDLGKHTLRNFLDPGGFMSKEHYAKEKAKKAAAGAAQTEAERQAAIKQGVSDVNATFDAPGRQKQYDDFATALRANYTDDATRQKSVADRQLKFSMARNGLFGGSADADARRASGEEFQKGILTAENKTQGAVADLKGQDEEARMQLIQLVTNGLDATTGVQRAGSRMQSNLEGRQAQGYADGLGDIFGNTANTYKKQQESAAFRRGLTAPQGSLYGVAGGR